MEQMKLPFNIAEISKFSVGDRVRIKDDYINDIYDDYFAGDDWDDDADDYDYALRDEHMDYLAGIFEIIQIRQIFKLDRVTHLRYEYHVNSDYIAMWFYEREIEKGE